MRRILTAFVIAAGAAGATSLAVIRTDKEIVIAADSRVTRFSSAESVPDMCKVRQTGNAIAAFVGHRAGKLLDPHLTKRIAAVVFAAVGAALVVGLL